MGNFFFENVGWLQTRKIWQPYFEYHRSWFAFSCVISYNRP